LRDAVNQTTPHEPDPSLTYLPEMPRSLDRGIAVVGAGFIVRDCHLVAYAEAGFHVVGLTSRNLDRAREVAATTLARVYDRVGFLPAQR